MPSERTQIRDTCLPVYAWHCWQNLRQSRANAITQTKLWVWWQSRDKLRTSPGSACALNFLLIDSAQPFWPHYSSYFSRKSCIFFKLPSQLYSALSSHTHYLHPFSLCILGELFRLDHQITYSVSFFCINNLVLYCF